jgi:hypothetical protein
MRRWLSLRLNTAGILWSLPGKQSRCSVPNQATPDAVYWEGTHSITSRQGVGFPSNSVDRHREGGSRMEGLKFGSHGPVIWNFASGKRNWIHWLKGLIAWLQWRWSWPSEGALGWVVTTTLSSVLLWDLWDTRRAYFYSRQNINRSFSVPRKGFRNIALTRVSCMEKHHVPVTF